jgi:DNA polymerase-3 subunit epsilon
MLDGRVLVAHNVPFDARFLEAEFNRCGVSLPPPPVMCTMQLASSLPAGAQPRRMLCSREHHPVAMAQRA